MTVARSCDPAWIFGWVSNTETASVPLPLWADTSTTTTTSTTSTTTAAATTARNRNLICSRSRSERFGCAGSPDQPCDTVAGPYHWKSGLPISGRCASLSQRSTCGTDRWARREGPRWSRGGALLRPESGVHAMVERVGRKVRATWPHHGAALNVDAHRCEPQVVRACSNTGPRMRPSTSTSPANPSANVTRRTPWRTTDTAVMSGVSPVI